ncbi:hypothetical protein PHLGIDRAFT_30487 [Phlebiopsis gigantea 11061_1 CR5-6]|uniref:Uncharacterized protein n=1 Tax=Phlebiopsis gigantea (strain 11061_1 CR5-6) TaxID=745531 RepID=A0A0C3NMZ7_PHLG1|nr:hypothetical protein PHLGIDRAFT_30487 [Phlebiopsis gigantea 11061_1 CR5-6]
MTSNTSPLSLNDTLRDLALLRACDVDLSSALPQEKMAAEPTEVDKSVDRSYEFAREARAALKLMNREEIEKQGARVEEVRGVLEDVTKGLESQS